MPAPNHTRLRALRHANPCAPAVANSCSRMRYSNAGDADAFKCRMCNSTDSNYHHWPDDRQLRRRKEPHTFNNVTWFMASVCSTTSALA
jgi:hypothetical protein